MLFRPGQFNSQRDKGANAVMGTNANKHEVLEKLDVGQLFRESIPTLRKTATAEASGLCPFHDDQNPSFTVNLETGLWCCHAGCGGGDVFSFVMKRDEVDFPQAVETLTRRATVKDEAKTEGRQVLRRFLWTDAEGRKAWRLRCEGKQKFIWAEDEAGAQPGRGGCTPTLYELEAVGKASDIILVEGEHDADTLNELFKQRGCYPLTVATCTPNGANDVKREFLDLLSGKVTVWVSGDNDKSGQRYTQQCIASLTGRVSQLRELQVPSSYKDWAEWAEGRAEPQEAFLKLLEDAPVIGSSCQEQANPGSARPLGRKPSAADVAEVFLDTRGYRDAVGLRLRWYRNDWYRYDTKVFAPIPTEEVKAEIMALLQRTRARKQAKRRFVGDVLGNLEGLCRMVPPNVSLPAKWSGHECIPQPDTVVMQNGIVDLKKLFAGETEDVLLPHTPSFVSTVCLPFGYDAKATCSGWETFLTEVLPDPEARQLLQQMFGYCLTYDTSHQKFFMFEGSGGNGKGVTTDILIRLLGEANVSSLPLESFGGTHDLVTTLGKLVNITSDIGELERAAEGLLKQFTGEDMMHFNPKYRPTFSAKATARLILSTNIRPPFRDRSEGLWRRLIILPFPTTIPKDRLNRNLKEELAEELSGIFNWAVEGARSLRERGELIELEGSRKAKEEFKREASSARLFLEETCEPDPTGSISKKELYGAYKEFCTEL